MEGRDQNGSDESHPNHGFVAATNRCKNKTTTEQREVVSVHQGILFKFRDSALQKSDFVVRASIYIRATIPNP
jgi:hypothetical protein